MLSRFDSCSDQHTLFSFLPKGHPHPIGKVCGSQGSEQAIFEYEKKVCIHVCWFVFISKVFSPWRQRLFWYTPKTEQPPRRADNAARQSGWFAMGIRDVCGDVMRCIHGLSRAETVGGVGEGLSFSVPRRRSGGAVYKVTRSTTPWSCVQQPHFIVWLSSLNDMAFTLKSLLLKEISCFDCYANLLVISVHITSPYYTFITIVFFWGYYAYWFLLYRQLLSG